MWTCKTNGNEMISLIWFGYPPIDKQSKKNV